MNTEKREMTKSARHAAMKLLQSPWLFSEILAAVRKLGLVEELQNALVTYIVGTSRLRQRPLNLMIKGASSSGKNFLADTILKLFPERSVHPLTSATDRSWNYLGDKLRNGIVYFKELNTSTGNVVPTRLLMSEGNLIHQVTVRRGGRYVTETHVTEGPIAGISTTTRDRIQVDDETRNLSIWIDESPEQTRRIVIAEAVKNEEEGVTADELEVWHAVQDIIDKRAAWPIARPDWLRIVAGQVRVDDVSVRRYFPTFLHACEIVCLLRSYRRRNQEQLKQERKLTISYIDYATTWHIFDAIVGKSLDRSEDAEMDTGRQIEKLSAENGGAPVQASDLAHAKNISDDRAYSLIRRAIDKGMVRRVNAPERTNRKLFLPSPLMHFAPAPASIFRQLRFNEVKFVHPLTGKWVIYRRSEDEKPNDRE